MCLRAKQRGANAVIGMRFDYSTVNDTMFMICCTGTAVNIRPKELDTLGPTSGPSE